MAATKLDFRIGTASAAMQIEGEMPRSNWHLWAERGMIADGTTPDRTTGHWERWREDNALMEELHLQIARISVEWARIEPERGRFDVAALARYRDEIADLKRRGIQPLVTLHHFGHPAWFEEMGAFTRDENVDLFLRFVEQVVDVIGDLVDDWVTINEPNVYVTQAYLFRESPPGVVHWRWLRASLRNLAVAHIRAYGLLHRRLDDDGGRRVRVTFAHHVRVFEPMNPRNPVHRAFTWIDALLFQRVVEGAFFSGRFHAFLGRQKGVEPGRYADAIAINYYSRTAVTGMTDEVFPDVPLTDLGWEIYPQGIVEVAEDLHSRYPLPIWITENGTADNGGDGEVERFRRDFLLDHLLAMANSSLPFERYYHWCFVDNWEWSEGMVPRFGIVHLDLETLERTPKPSAHMLRDIIDAGAITDEIQAAYRHG